MTKLERLGVDLLTRPFGFSGLPLERRRALLHDTIEPMIQRELNHRGLVPENGGYSSKLIGWVEVGRRAFHERALRLMNALLPYVVELERHLNAPHLSEEQWQAWCDTCLDGTPSVNCGASSRWLT